MTQEIPNEVRDGIRRAVKETRPDDQEGQDFEFDRECEAFVKLSNLSPDDVPADMLAGMKQKAAAESGEHEYFAQLSEVQQAIKDHRYVQQTRAKIAPIRDMLARMESIISSACYNPKTQNYGRRGERENDGRSYRYPVTYINGGQKDQRKDKADDLPPEVLITGHYEFGANRLGIYRALVDIIYMLEADYGLKIPRTGARGSKRLPK
ncbi:hypothetical protein [Verminephrobacter eiseniae]|uniref:hypothetical protein n=1 Tax=Verminephrobacter eiseniae TaxID=364317 RepID=UPI002237AB95|nr:hypothetical protein [Verminephrobacter eiseniae]MCW5237686.1 hypothetical protein [Verminephrobacter eiseniae]